MATKHHLKKRIVKSGARPRTLEIKEGSLDPFFCLNFSAKTDKDALNIFVKTLAKKNSTGFEQIPKTVQTGDSQSCGHIVS